MSTISTTSPVRGEVRRGAVKCVVWDLDGTVWDGTLLEGDEVRVRPSVVEAIETLSDRGVLNSIASRNDHDLAKAKLAEAGIEDHFVYPQINWQPKSKSIAEIAERLNIGIDALAFVDD